MCGIAILTSAQPLRNPELLEIMLDSIAHRGPDDEGMLVHDTSSDTYPLPGKSTAQASFRNAHPDQAELNYLPSPGGKAGTFQLGLGHRRLSILDLSPRGHQPLATQDGNLWLTFNGEVYNFKELRAELKTQGFSFRTETDTEVVLAGFRAWGTDLFGKLVGMFSIGILDRASGRLTIARDPFGIKPLYWWSGQGTLAFCSEIKGLLKLPQVQRKANPAQIYRFLRSGNTDTDSGETLFTGIHQVPPGAFAQFSLDSLPERPQFQHYWKPSIDREPAARGLSFESAAEKLRHLFLESVKLHLRSDVPIGACLSGGIDSSAIVMAMRHLEGSNLDLNTFSFVPEDPSLSEESWIDLVSQAARSKSHKIHPSAQDLESSLSILIRNQDEPFGSTSIFAQYSVFKLAAQNGIKVMLDGQGADELLGGYRPYASMLSSMLHSGAWSRAQRFYGSLNSYPGVDPKHVLKQLIGGYVPRGLSGFARSVAGKPSVPGWMNPQWLDARGVKTRLRPNRVGRNALKQELLDALTDTSLPALLRYEDRNSMTFSIESRVPFLVTGISDFIFSLPENYLVSDDGWTKAVFRRAMRGIVPDAVLNRKDKIGFTPPERTWLGQSREWVRQVLSSETAHRIGVLNLPEAQREFEAVLEGRASFDYRIWRWLNLVLWAEAYEVSFEL